MCIREASATLELVRELLGIRSKVWWPGRVTGLRTKRKATGSRRCCGRWCTYLDLSEQCDQYCHGSSARHLASPGMLLRLCRSEALDHFT